MTSAKAATAATLADAATDLASARLIPLLADSIESGDAALSVELPSVPGDKEEIDEQGQKVYEEAICRGGEGGGRGISLAATACL